MIFGIDLQHHAILVRLTVDGRNLALSEGIVKSVVERLHRHAKPPGDDPVGLDHDSVSILLNVGRDVAQPAVVFQLLFELFRPVRKTGPVQPDEHVLILGVARACPDLNILDDLEGRIDTGNLACGLS